MLRYWITNRIFKKSDNGNINNFILTSLEIISITFRADTRWQAKAGWIILSIAGWSSHFFCHLLPGSSNSRNGHGFSGMFFWLFLHPRSRKSMTIPVLQWVSLCLHTLYYTGGGLSRWQNRLSGKRHKISFPVVGKVKTKEYPDPFRE